MNYLNDSHSQLIVHWLGEGTNVMICLARDQPLGPKDDAKSAPPPPPSSVFISYDYGDTFEDKTEMFKVLVNDTELPSTLDTFSTHSNFSTVSIVLLSYLQYYFFQNFNYITYRTFLRITEDVAYTIKCEFVTEDVACD